MVMVDSKTGKTTFSVHLSEAESVNLLGNFNGWNEDKHPLKKDKSGNWSITLKLPTGEYEFLYRVNKKAWMVDDKAPRKTNPFGTENCLVSVVIDMAKRANTEKKSAVRTNKAKSSKTKKA
ncbi:MAG TPA: isoamylase early set domain-containing protein [bacterium]|nr:isoamylase early set domain-containing protein [bacterium]